MTLALQPGSKLLHYEIVAPVGVGGMGEVYRAVDSTLGREVAIKVLPIAFAADAERLARFEREARLLASLNHPNIAAVYGLHELAGNRFLAMELVPGETLAARLDRGGLAMAEALAIARQIADALAAAHDQGVIHRDLKPGNIQVTDDGRVKVLDFGLAKGLEAQGAGSGDLAHSPTLTFGATVEGVILGTAAYMSPEQARGRPVDRRADVWAFGCVLWEMLTGRQLFGGETASDTIASVLRSELDWGALPEETPPSVRRLLKRCLERDPAKRLRDLGDARLELDETAPAETTPAPAEANREAASSGRLPWVVAGVALLVAVAALGWTLLRSPTARVPDERAIRFTAADPPLVESAGNPRIAISPDGNRLFWVANRAGRRVLVSRLLDRLEAQDVAGSEDLDGIATVAADGTSVAILRDNSVEWLALRGGSPDRLARFENFRGAALADDGALWLSTSTESGILRVARAGGEMTPIVMPDAAAGERSFRWPALLPGGEGVLYTVATAELQSFADARIEAYSTSTQRRSVVVDKAAYPIFLAPDRLFFMRSGGLFEAKLDLRQLTIVGEPRLVQDGISEDPLSGLADVALARDGSLLYVPSGDAVPQRRLLEVDLDGNARPITAETGPYQKAEASPDGKTIVVDIDAAGAQLWLIERERGTRVRLTSSWSNNTPVWSRDGQTVYYNSGRGARRHIFAQRLDGGAPVSIAESDLGLAVLDVSPDGQKLLHLRAGAQGSDLWELPLDGTSPASPLIVSPYSESGGRYSPDGRWLAFVSDESNRNEIYLQPLPGPGRKLRVSTDGGFLPVWTPDGRAIVFCGGDGGDEIFSARVALGAEATVERPRRLLKLDASIQDLSMAPDGKLVVVLNPPPRSSPPPPLIVARGWDTPPSP